MKKKALLTLVKIDPYVASKIAIKANKILQKSIIDFKIKNIKLLIILSTRN